MADLQDVSQSVIELAEQTPVQTDVSQSTLETDVVERPPVTVSQSALEVAVFGTIPVISCGNPPLAFVGTAYSHAFPVVGQNPPVVFAIIAGSLPPGLTLDPSTGVASGIPTTAGLYGFIVRVTDALGFMSQAICSINVAAVALASLVGLRIILRGVKRVRKQAAPEPCPCPELSHVKRAV